MKFRVGMPGMSLYPGTGRHWWEHITPTQVQEIAREIDRLGYDYVSVSEHLIMDRHSVPELGPRWSHSLAASSLLVGVTQRIVVVPLIVVPYHHPVALAKSLSTLDFLSGGRVIPLCLVGYNQHEFSIMNVAYADRGAIMDEWVAAMIELWGSDDPVFEGRWVRFADIVFEPRPARQPMTMWFGGRTLVAMRRIGRVGDGWVAQSTVPRSRLTQFVTTIREQPEFEARPRPLDISLELFEGNRDPVTHRIINAQLSSGIRTPASPGKEPQRGNPGSSGHRRWDSAGPARLRGTVGPGDSCASGAAADEVAYQVGDGDRQGAEGKLAQARPQHWPTGQPADRHAAACQRDRGQRECQRQ